MAVLYAEGHFTLDRDAYNDQVGCALLQAQPDNTSEPVGYWTRTLTKHELAYDTIQRECAVRVCPDLILGTYLEENWFTIHTDLDCQKWMLDLADARGRLARRRRRLSDFEFDVVHRVGIKHQAADVLPRMPTDSADTTPTEEDIPIAETDASSNLTNEISLSPASTMSGHLVCRLGQRPPSRGSSKCTYLL